MEWPVIAKGQIIMWKPLPGLDSSLGEDAMRIGATVFAQMKTSGKPEDQCHIAAEKAAFEYYYKVSYKY
jgi:hypothetical protein